MKTAQEHKNWVINEMQKFVKQRIPHNWLTIHMTKEIEDIYQNSQETGALGEGLVERLKKENVRDIFHHLLGCNVKWDQPELKVTNET